jgi:hypothetical protein
MSRNNFDINNNISDYVCGSKKQILPLYQMISYFGGGRSVITEKRRSGKQKESTAELIDSIYTLRQHFKGTTEDQIRE